MYGLAGYIEFILVVSQVRRSRVFASNNPDLILQPVLD